MAETTAPIETSITCPCGKSTVKTSVAPMAACICHCYDCRKMTQGCAFEGIIFPTGSFQTAEGTTLTSTKRPDMTMHMKTCPDCTVKVYHTNNGNLDILAGMEYRRSYNVKDLPAYLKPQMHAYYKDRLHDINDDLPKFADFPEGFGGTGKMLNNDGTPIE